MSWKLTDEEIADVIVGCGFELPVEPEYDIERAIAQAQARKIAKWLQEQCIIKTEFESLVITAITKMDWQAFREEIELH